MYSDAYQRYRKLVSAGRFDHAAQLAAEAYVAGSPNNPFWLTRQAAALVRGHQYKAARTVAGQALTLELSTHTLFWPWPTR